MREAGRDDEHDRVSADEPTLAASDGPTLAAADGPARALAAEELPSRIGRYVVIDTIGEGGMGLVFAAYDPELDRKVAVKLVRPALHGSDSGASGDPHRRLLREAQVLARLSHPNIIHVYEVGTLGESVFIAMEHFEGPTLKRWQDRAESWRETLAIYRAAGRGLAAAHAAGLVHRDFKAENVLVGEDGQVRVIDFGLAREEGAGKLAAQLDREGTGSLEHLTMTGAIMGTPAYMAPEQHRGGKVDARTDQFSFCVSLYEALYGERPFAGASLAELTANVLAGTIQPPPPFERVPPWLRRALLRGLAVDPQERYPSISDLLAELGQDPGTGRRRVLVGVAVIAVALAGSFTWDRVREAQRARAEGERLRLEFGRTRASNAEDELRRLRARTPAQRFDDLVLAWAKDQVERDPTRALASLRHLQDLDAKLGAARTIAADAWQRGVARRSTGLPGDVIGLGVTDGGELLATLDPLGIVRTWWVSPASDASRSRSIWTCPEPATTLAVAHSAPLLAVGTAEGTIHLLDLDTSASVDAPDSRRVERIEAHQGAVHALAFSSDDLVLASAGEDHAVRRWDAHTGERIDAMTNHGEPVVALSYELGGVALASASASGELGWWDPGTGKVRTVDAHRGASRSLSAANETVWSVGEDGRVSRWRPGEQARAIELEDVTAVSATASGTLVAIHEDGSVTLSEADPQAAPHRLTVGGPVTRVAHSPGDDGVWLAGPGVDVQRWDATLDHATVWPSEDHPRALAFSPAGERLAIAGSRRSFRVLNSGGEALLELELGGVAERMSWSPDGGRVAVQLASGAIELVSIEGGERLALVNGWEQGELLGQVDGGPHPGLAWTEDGGALAFATCFYANRCGATLVDAGSELGELRGPPTDVETVSTLSPDPTGRSILLGRRDLPTVAVLEVESGEIAETSFADEELQVLGQAWSDTGEGRVRIATASGDRLSVWSWDPASGRRHHLLDESGFVELTASEDATAVYLRSADKLALLWSIAGTRFTLVPELPRGVEHIRLAADGRTLLARGREDRTGFGFLLDLETGQGRRLPQLLEPVALSAQGIVADHRFGAGVRVWDDPTPSEVEAFRAWLDWATSVDVPIAALRE